MAVKKLRAESAWFGQHHRAPRGRWEGGTSCAQLASWKLSRNPSQLGFLLGSSKKILETATCVNFWHTRPLTMQAFDVDCLLQAYLALHANNIQLNPLNGHTGHTINMAKRCHHRLSLCVCIFCSFPSKSSTSNPNHPVGGMTRQCLQRCFTVRDRCPKKHQYIAARFFAEVWY